MLRGEGAPASTPTGSEAGNKGMPVVMGPVPPRVEMHDTSRPLIIDPVERKEFNAGTIPDIIAEIHPAVAEPRSEAGGTLSLIQLPRIIFAAA